jgi:multicomponent Na+:H+ antiporter subunit D
MSAFIPWVVAIPLVGASLSFLRLGGSARLVGLVGGAGTLAAVLALTRAVWAHGPQHYPVGGWGAPLGIELHADGFSVTMLLMTAGVALSIGVYGLGYFPAPAHRQEWNPDEAFWPLLLFLWSALNTVFLSADIFNLYVGLELMTLAAVAQVMLATERGAHAAAMRYLLAAFLGSLMYLLGVALLYASFHTLDIALLGERMQANTASRGATALLTIGLALKSALFPFHFWLPRAHSIAPAPVSAALSALVVGAPYYVLVRLWVDVFPAVMTYPVSQVMGALGAGAIVWGSLQALRQQTLKLMIAYSTVAQTGYLFLLLPLIAGPAGWALAGESQPWALHAWEGGIYHAISHAFAKAAMFLAAGNIAHALGDDRLVGISGIATHIPVTTYAFAISGLSLVGIPPTGGFVSKWLLLGAAIESGQWWWTTVILAGSLFTAGYVFQILTQVLSRAESDHRPQFAPVPRVMEAATIALAIVALLLGLRAAEPLLLLEVGSQFAPGPAIGAFP